MDLKERGLLLSDKFQIAFQIGNYYKKPEETKGAKGGGNLTGTWTSFVRIKDTSQKHLIAALVEKIEFQYCTETHVRKPNSEKNLYQNGPGKNHEREEVWHTNNDGWGYHEVNVDIHFRPELGFTNTEQFDAPFFTTTHQIHLDGIGKWNTFFLTFDKKKLDLVIDARKEEIKKYFPRIKKYKPLDKSNKLRF